MLTSKNQFGSRRSSGSAGFSLIELLMVVAIIMVIVGIAIPNFIRSRMRANEASAVASLRTIATSSTVYSTTYVGFEPSLASLGGTVCSNPTPAQSCLIDSVLSAGLKSGYIFTYTPLYPDINNNYTAYSVTAGPLTPGTTGDRYFYVDQTAVIRQNLATTAGPTDPPLQ